ncbi:MAG TPA: hypothetical protein DCY74_08645 [Clostridiales bacterium]|jgi:hypothetical protein|nr:hypothetical protein [Clostridiales bacterium]HBE14223.1 hypothetical protein [Clostridiales bacterium]HCG35517.1 hypothetical protein [Clostridiales bacterium]
MTFIFPRQGDCLTVYDGIPQANGVKVTVKVKSKKPVTINQQPARLDNGVYCLDILFDAYLTLLTVSDGESEETIRVYYLANAQNTVSLAVEDNIFFLQDLTHHQHVYKSIFDNPYLAVCKEAHDQYGAKITFNLFYETDSKSLTYFSSPREHFQLSMMTDKYQNEFMACSDWLKLTFHSNCEYPPDPYLHATYEETAKDIALAHHEIRRFAGESSLSGGCNVHYGSANREAVRACRNFGYKCLSGFFTFLEGQPFVSYYLDADIVSRLDHRDFWYDASEDMFYNRTDLILNRTPYEQLIPALEQVYADVGRKSNLTLLMHEQYFYPDYCAYLPRFKELILDTFAWAKEKGYTPALMDEIIDEKQQKRKS